MARTTPLNTATTGPASAGVDPDCRGPPWTSRATASGSPASAMGNTRTQSPSGTSMAQNSSSRHAQPVSGALAIVRASVAGEPPARRRPARPATGRLVGGGRVYRTGCGHGPIVRSGSAHGRPLPSGQASRRTSSQPPIASATAAYRLSTPRPAHADRKCGHCPAPVHSSGLVVVSEFPMMKIGR